VSHPPAHPRAVCAIVVTYHPDAEFTARLAGISRQVAAVVIVDNGSDAELAMLREAASDPRVTLVLNRENLGVARALNIGIHRALALGFRMAVLFDQDSCVDNDLVETLLAIHDSFPAGRLGVVGSGFRTREAAAAEPSPDPSGAPPWVDAEYVITSGSLLPMAAYSAIGPFREEFFIDYVDLDYCKRAVAHGLQVIQSRRALMTHSIGAPTQHPWLWMTKATTNHSADRRYYGARNKTVMLRDYGNYRRGGWILKSLLSCLKICKRVLLYEDSKIPKLRALLSGWWDGVHGNLGPRNQRR
jgi:rhamnosyltransferase